MGHESVVVWTICKMPAIVPDPETGYIQIYEDGLDNILTLFCQYINS